jgi:hypothetical protein
MWPHKPFTLKIKLRRFGRQEAKWHRLTQA